MSSDELNPDLPEFDLDIRVNEVRAKPRKLKGKWSSYSADAKWPKISKGDRVIDRQGRRGVVVQINTEGGFLDETRTYVVAPIEGGDNRAYDVSELDSTDQVPLRKLHPLEDLAREAEE